MTATHFPSPEKWCWDWINVDSLVRWRDWRENPIMLTGGKSACHLRASDFNEERRKKEEKGFLKKKNRLFCFTWGWMEITSFCAMKRWLMPGSSNNYSTLWCPKTHLEYKTDLSSLLQISNHQTMSQSHKLPSRQFQWETQLEVRLWENLDLHI